MTQYEPLSNNSTPSEIEQRLQQWQDENGYIVVNTPRHKVGDTVETEVQDAWECPDRPLYKVRLIGESSWAEATKFAFQYGFPLPDVLGTYFKAIAE